MYIEESHRLLLILMFIATIVHTSRNVVDKNTIKWDVSSVMRNPIGQKCFVLKLGVPLRRAFAWVWPRHR